jgi:beta-lactamase class A
LLAGFIVCTAVPDARAAQEADKAVKQGGELLAAAAAIEQRLNARVGLAILDTQTGRRWMYRAEERFALTSTFKAFACAGVLARVAAGEEELERQIAIEKEDLVTYSPVTEQHAGARMTLGALCEAALRVSDNTAGNLVLRSLGGPEGFTAFMRRLGDTQTRLDRWETALNEARPGDLRDTTTPAAAMASLHEVLLGERVPEEGRARLTGWMQNNEVAGPLLRASLPQTWRIADRSGAGGNGARGIIAVIWPNPQGGRAPVVAAVYLAETDADMEARNAAIAEIGAALVKALAR